MFGGHNVDAMPREQQCRAFLNVFYPDSETVYVSPKNVYPLDKSLDSYSEESSNGIFFDKKYSTPIPKSVCVDLIVNKDCKNLLVKMGDNPLSFCRFESDLDSKEEQVKQVVRAFENWEYFRDNLACVLDSGGRSIHSVVRVTQPTDSNKKYITVTGVENYFHSNDLALGRFFEQFIRIAGSVRPRGAVTLLYLK
jgi:hypothetical protein